jgi:hypothetical protein
MRLRHPDCAPLGALMFGALLLLAPIAHGADILFGSVFGTHFPGNEAGYGGALTWQRTLDAGGFLLGASDSIYPIGTLSEGDVDTYYRASTHLTVNAGFSVGAAWNGTSPSTLYKGRLSVDSQLNPLWTVHAGYQYIDLDLIHVNLATSSVEYRPVPAWVVKAGGGYSIDGSVADRYGNAEIDWFGKQRFFAGVVLGRTGYDPANLGQVALIERMFQLYTGAAVPIVAGTLNIGLDTLSLEGSARQTLRIGFTQTIKP